MVIPGAGRRRVLTEAEVRARLPVWDAIADLWLDTEIDAPMLERIAAGLARSPFSVDELGDIYLYEVAPVVHGNLKIVAGEWVGFGEEWLGERIPAYLARAGRWSRWWAGSRPGRWWRTADTRADWQTVVRRIVELRARA